MYQRGGPITMYRGIQAMETLINASRYSGPPNWTLIQIKELQKGPRTSGRTDGRTDRRAEILYFHSGYLKPWPAAEYAARNYRPRAFITKN